MDDRSSAPDEGWPPYVVVCLDLETTAPDGHDHVLGAETRDPDGGQTKWTTGQVIAAIGEGERFLVAEDDGAGETILEPGTCPRCAAATLVVDPREARPLPCA